MQREEQAEDEEQHAACSDADRLPMLLQQHREGVCRSRGSRVRFFVRNEFMRLTCGFDALYCFLMRAPELLHGSIRFCRKFRCALPGILEIDENRILLLDWLASDRFRL